MVGKVILTCIIISILYFLRREIIRYKTLIIKLL